MKIRFLALFTLSIFLLASSLSLTQASSQNDLAVKKVAAWVLEQTEKGEAEFLVVLAEQADLSGAARLHTKEEKGRFVYEALFKTAQATQGPILEWLRERGIEHRSYYIVNLIWVKGSLDVAMALAARPDVAGIEGNPQILNVVPPPADAAAPLAVEGGITYTRAPEVWSQGYTGQGIVAAGADTGYRWDHTALRDHYRGWNGASANHDYNWHDSIHSGGGSCGANSPQPCDDNGHGTHTMGTMVGDDGAGNQVGMAPGAKWIGCRNMDQGVGTPATYIECFEFFLAPYPVGGTPAQGDPAKAPHVTNNSWGCPPSEGCSASTLQAAVEAQRAAGIVTVVAAGNAGPNCSSVNDPPAIYDASYSIGAFNHGTGTIASFSSRGPVTLDGSNRLKPDISAPGVGIRSSTRTSTTSYGTSSGTSMAAPHTTGAVALLLSAKPALGGQVDEIEGYLNDTAVQVSTTSCSSSGSPNNVYGAGRLDVKTAVDLALTTISPVDEWYPETGGEGTVQVSAPAGTGWSATSNASWIDISSASAGVGNGIVVYAVRDNLTGSPRQGTITIARKTFTVTQDGGVMSDCLYVITPTSQAFNAGGGTGVVTVFAEERCSWSARSNATWITVTSGCCGIGNGSISYSVGANGSSKPRKGTITIAGRTFSIKQKGTP